MSDVYNDREPLMDALRGLAESGYNLTGTIGINTPTSIHLIILPDDLEDE